VADHAHVPLGRLQVALDRQGDQRGEHRAESTDSIIRRAASSPETLPSAGTGLASPVDVWTTNRRHPRGLESVWLGCMARVPLARVEITNDK
jgi:hypothetical protein